MVGNSYSHDIRAALEFGWQSSGSATHPTSPQAPKVRPYVRAFART